MNARDCYLITKNYEYFPHYLPSQGFILNSPKTSFKVSSFAEFPMQNKIKSSESKPIKIDIKVNDLETHLLNTESKLLSTVYKGMKVNKDYINHFIFHNENSGKPMFHPSKERRTVHKSELPRLNSPSEEPDRPMTFHKTRASNFRIYKHFSKTHTKLMSNPHSNYNMSLISSGSKEVSVGLQTNRKWKQDKPIVNMTSINFDYSQLKLPRFNQFMLKKTEG